MNKVFHGDCRDTMRNLIADGIRVQCIVTSPPYWGLRDYGVAGQIGLEPTLQEFIGNLVEVFELCRQMLSDDGTCWINMGDSYVSSGGSGFQGKHGERADRGFTQGNILKNTVPKSGLKPKDMVGQPWRLAFALQDAGWWLRQDIIWHKPNPMPESVQDRCTKAHEYMFLFARSERYYFDAAAIAEPLGLSSYSRLAQNIEEQTGSSRVIGKTNGPMKAVGRRAAGNKTHKGVTAYISGDEKLRTKAGLVSFAEREREKVAAGDLIGTRNKRTVWTIATEAFNGAHFAVMPESLVEPCILSGSRVGDIVFDPFLGSGTVARVAQRLGRQWIGCELNPDYHKLIAERTQQQGFVL